MFIYSIVGLISALHFSSGFNKLRIRTERDVPDCGGSYTVRKTFLQELNEKRALFALGNEGVSGAANMRFMEYDCDLEKKAIELTKTCESFPTQVSGNRTNVARFGYQGIGEVSAAKKAVSDWWNTKERWDKSQKITNDSAMPFFLIAQAEAGKVGCSVNLCGTFSYYTVACVYETAVEIGSDLYQQGEACTKCTGGTDDEFYQGALCRKKQ